MSKAILGLIAGAALASFASGALAQNFDLLGGLGALVNLGYSRDIASNAIAAAMTTVGEDADSSKLIRFGLKDLAR